VKFIFCLALMGAPLWAAAEPVRYELSFPAAAHHEVEVKARFARPPATAPKVHQPVRPAFSS
jgi:hypothetical protein